MRSTESRHTDEYIQSLIIFNYVHENKLCMLVVGTPCMQNVVVVIVWL